MHLNTPLSQAPKDKANNCPFLDRELDDVSPNNGKISFHVNTSTSQKILSHMLYYFLSYYRDIIIDAFNKVHIGSFPTKTGYRLLGTNSLFGNGQLLDEEILQMTKQLLYKYITPQDKGEFTDIVQATHVVAVHGMLELEDEGCDIGIISTFFNIFFIY